MKQKIHTYPTSLRWTGNTGEGTTNYRGYERSHEISVPGKPIILGSSDPSFRGDAQKYNPEELLVASLSSCHMLWVLHLCTESGVVVTAYEDQAEGVMIETADGGGRFQRVCLRPRISVQEPAMAAQLPAIHERAHKLCFIANSVNFPVTCEPVVE